MMVSTSAALGALIVVLLLISKTLDALSTHLAKSATEPDSEPSPARADARAGGEAFVPLWTDDVLAERERLERPDTLGADAFVVDTFGLEEDERQYALEQRLRADRDAVRRRPPR